MRLDVRRLAAVDMYGVAGTRFRRRVILLEFVLGAVAGVGLGGLVAVAVPSVGWRVFAIWMVGIGLNYVPLALHALSLSPADRLEAELDGVDVGSELRYYTAAQLAVFIPALLAVVATWQAIRRRA